MVPPRSLVSARWQLFGIAEETSWGAFLYQIYQKWIIDTNDLQWGWILCIISKTGYFGCMIQSVSLLRIRKE